LDNHIDHLEPGVSPAANSRRRRYNDEDLTPIREIPQDAVQILRFRQPRKGTEHVCKTLFLDKSEPDRKDWVVWIIVSSIAGRTVKHSKPGSMSVSFENPETKKSAPFNWKKDELFDEGPTLGELSDRRIMQLMSHIDEDDKINHYRTYYEIKKKKLEQELQELEIEKEEVERILQARKAREKRSSS
jgi:hypothetical protein